MEKILNQDAIQLKCEEHGLSQSSIAEQLGVTRAAVSKWFKAKSFPRPAELLKLGRLLGLKHNELVESTALSVEEPMVAFRKRAACKTTDKHVTRAKEMGQLLRPLAAYLDFDPFIGPPSLKTPSTNYPYLQALAKKVRQELKLGEDSCIEFSDLIEIFHKHQAVIVPTLWGKKSKHENALHIYLPDSKTTWIYLNLDVELHDFKFWMAHELGHVLTVDLLEAKRYEEAEDFADQFAGALLFPETTAKNCLLNYRRLRSDKSRLKLICEQASTYQISPYSVYLETEKYANAHQQAFEPIPQSLLHSGITAFNKNFPSLSEILFDGKTPNADHFMRIAQENFATDIFKALGEYIKERSPSPTLIASILSVSPMDGHAYYDALAQ